MKIEEVASAAAKPQRFDPTHITRSGKPKRLSKRHFTDLEKQAYVMQLETRLPTETIKEFCAKHDLAEGPLRNWRTDKRYRYRPDKVSSSPAKDPGKALVKNTPKKISAVVANTPDKNGRYYAEAIKFKVAAAHADKAHTGKSVKEIAKDFGVREPMVYAWARDPRYAAPDPHRTIAEHQEANGRPERIAKKEAKLEIEVRKLRLTVGILRGMLGMAALDGFTFDLETLGG